MVRVLCVEDDPMVRGYLCARLGSEPDVQVVGEAATAGAACTALREQEVDVILLDYHLEGADGMQLLQVISLWYDELPADRLRPAVLFCTGCTEAGFETRARAQGADGVVFKDRLAAQLVPAIRAVAAGRGWFDGGASVSIGAMESRRSKVIVATQEKLLRAHLSEGLLRHDCVIAHAWRSEEVLGLLEREPFHLLVVDDRLSGRILTTDLLEQVGVRCPELPVLFVAAPPPGMEHYEPASNVVAVLKKPFSGRQLEDAVDSILGLMPIGREHVSRSGYEAHRSPACLSRTALATGC